MVAQITKQVTKNIRNSIKASQVQQSTPKSGGQPSKSTKSNVPTADDPSSQASKHHAWMTKQGFPAGRTEWRTFFPSQWDPASAGLRHQGKRWKWCSTCAKWMLHHADKHDEWVASTKDRGKEKTKVIRNASGSAVPLPKPTVSARAQANLAVVGDDSDDCDSVGTWTGILI
jgi:hypothetical protein